MITIVKRDTVQGLREEIAMEQAMKERLKELLYEAQEELRESKEALKKDLERVPSPRIKTLAEVAGERGVAPGSDAAVGLYRQVCRAAHEKLAEDEDFALFLGQLKAYADDYQANLHLRGDQVSDAQIRFGQGFLAALQTVCDTHRAGLLEELPRQLKQGKK